ncbi:MAG: helicase, partial [Gammaproteobacteria bacterium]|nr:helicase [Gammaproteobacteria bacterium]
KQRALAVEEHQDIITLLRAVRRLPTDTKATKLIEAIQGLRQQGHSQVMVFTQYGDTMDFLREILDKELSLTLLCYSGRGGEIRNPDGTWQSISREESKRRFRKGLADIMVCTDAAAEGLNFQFCGALVNYDMPWNPMRVEQRIGRIDRLGQKYPRIRIVNLHYEDTVETDVYMALRKRIDLFTIFVGRLQPILSKLPRALSAAALGRKEDRDRERAELKDSLIAEVQRLEQNDFDLDEESEFTPEEFIRQDPLYDLEDLHGILANPKLLPPGIELAFSNNKEFSWREPGRIVPAGITTDRDYFEQHPESVELWSPGSPVFPQP